MIELDMKRDYRRYGSCIHFRSSVLFYWLGKCHNCHNIMLVINQGEKIYPTALPSPSDERIPEDIRNDLDEAKMCFSVDCYRASIVISRRALQACCIDKGADKKDGLITQIDYLSNEGIITKDMKDWADIIRWIGNDAAHINANEVSQEDAKEILNLAEQIFHIIYVAPAIAKERQAKRIKSMSGKSP